MDMRQAFLMAGGLLVMYSASSAMPVSAQGYANKRPAVDTSHLQPVEFFHYRPIVSIDDDSAIVNDHRHRTPKKKLVIQVPPMEEEGGVEVVTNGPSNPMMGQRFLDSAGPRSYVRQQPLTQGRDLPSGTSTGVHSRQAPPAVAHDLGVPGQFTGVKRGLTGRLTAPRAAVYQEPVGSIGGTTSSRVNTSTSIKMLDKIK